MKNVVCIKCGDKLKVVSRSSEDGGFILKMKCKNRGCKAVFSMRGKSYADVMRKVWPVQEQMRGQKIASRRTA